MLKDFLKDEVSICKDCEFLHLIVIDYEEQVRVNCLRNTGIFNNLNIGSFKTNVYTKNEREYNLPVVNFCTQFKQTI